MTAPGKYGSHLERPLQADRVVTNLPKFKGVLDLFKLPEQGNRRERLPIR
jgi:hypothetical protein